MKASTAEQRFSVVDKGLRLLVAPHDLTMGGSQMIAVDLAAGAAQAGHEVAVYGVPGPLVDHIRARGLEFIPARPLRYRPAPSRIAQLATLTRRRGFDVIHAYEWPPCLEAYYGAHLAVGAPLLCTVMSMSVSPLVPRSVPVVMGTEDLADQARADHRAAVWALEPPVDTEADHPGIDGRAFRRSLGIPDDAGLIATVTRLSTTRKLDAVARAIDAVDLLAGTLPVQLVVAGGGPAEGALQERAATVNGRWGRELIRFTGQVWDPRPIYAAADVVVGMGSSALRAMAIGRPVVVQGADGFSEVFEPATREHFLRHGFFGFGDDDPTVERLAGQFRALLIDPVRRAELGAYGRAKVEERFSLPRAVARQNEIYAEVVELGRRTSARDAATAASRALQIEIQAHDPRRKRTRRELEQSLLRAASRLGERPAHA
jgi:L-malate glycosyltransferase